jgi:hypothetical protein
MSQTRRNYREAQTWRGDVSGRIDAGLPAVRPDHPRELVVKTFRCDYPDCKQTITCKVKDLEEHYWQQKPIPTKTVTLCPIHKHTDITTVLRQRSSKA